MTKRELRREFDQKWLQGKPKEFVSSVTAMMVARMVCQIIAMIMVLVFLVILSGSNDGAPTGALICLVIGGALIAVGDGLDATRKAE